MDDSFSFGKPARRQVAISSPRARTPRAEASSGRSGARRIASLVLAGIVVIVAIVGFMTVVKGGGEEIGSSERSAVSQTGAAQDVEAKMTAQQAAAAVQQLYAEQGSFDAGHRRGPAQLRAVVAVHGGRVDRAAHRQHQLVVDRRRARRALAVGRVLPRAVHGLRRHVRHRHVLHRRGCGVREGIELARLIA
jgi:hypothetical protein